MCEDAYFQLRMSKKQLDRLSKKAEKEQKQQEAKVGGKTFMFAHTAYSDGYSSISFHVELLFVI